jgi:antitoxin component YwqK of YwqJK toxin-antitoxin module
MDAPPVNTYYSTGMLREQVEQTRSRRVERSFFATGVMQRETTYAMNGDQPVREREVTFAASGVLLREQRWAGAEPVLDTEFLASGVLRSKREYSGMGPTRELRVQTFYASGVLATEERYAAPSGSSQLTPIGVQKTFDQSGRPIDEKTYDAQGRLVSEQRQAANGEWTSPASPTSPSR